MEFLKFDERLYTLNVENVPKEEIPRIVDPNESELNNGVVVCYNPTKDQQLQLALIIWQVATRDRNSSNVGTKQFEIHEKLCTKARNVLKSLLLPYVAGDSDKAKDLCVTLLCENRPVFEKYVKQWSIIRRPSSVWVDKDTNGIFVCENGGRIVVGLNPTNFVFVYKK